MPLPMDCAKTLLCAATNKARKTSHGSPRASLKLAVAIAATMYYVPLLNAETYDAWVFDNDNPHSLPFSWDYVDNLDYTVPG